MEKYEKPVMEVEELDDIHTNVSNVSGNGDFNCVSSCPPSNPR